MTLLDTGPLVALFNARDEYREVVFTLSFNSHLTFGHELGCSH